MVYKLLTLKRLIHALVGKGRDFHADVVQFYAVKHTQYYYLGSCPVFVIVMLVVVAVVVVVVVVVVVALSS